MINLFSYEILNNHVFYRGWHILTYIEQNPDMSDLDKEAVCATIMDALVSNNLINPNEDALDIDQLAIVKSKDDKYYHYQKHPFVSGFPLWMKDKWRHKCMNISGNIPASLNISMPSGPQRRCIYDLNTVASSIFDDVEFSHAEYDSPTRPGIRATQRPFLKVKIEGVDYFVDTITKRIFNFEEFKRRYNLVLTDEAVLNNLSSEAKKEYNEATDHDPSRFGDVLVSIDMFISTFKQSPRCAEYIYEYEKSKELYPEAWQEKERIEQEIEQMKSGDFAALIDSKRQTRKKETLD